MPNSGQGYETIIITFDAIDEHPVVIDVNIAHVSNRLIYLTFSSLHSMRDDPIRAGLAYESAKISLPIQQLNTEKAVKSQIDQQRIEV